MYLLACFSYRVQLLFDYIRYVHHVLLVGQQFPLLQEFFDGELVGWLFVLVGNQQFDFFRAGTLEGSLKSVESSSQL